MKKQTIFDLASMPKMVLVVTLIVILGALFGATSYLVKISKIDLPIINSIIETQCEIDSDCELAFTGSDICLPCDTSIEEYKCFPLEKAKKIEEERFKKMVDSNVFCERCLEKPQHTCKCENGKCEKVNFYPIVKISKQKALEIASQTEEAKEFLKLYPDAKSIVYDFIPPTFPPVKRMEVIYWIGDISALDSKINAIIIVDENGKIISRTIIK